jgi:hypothetical protein
MDPKLDANVDRLTRALAATPDMRPEAVARARELIEAVHYPPAETTQRIAHLLAMCFRVDCDDSSNG